MVRFIVSLLLLLASLAGVIRLEGGNLLMYVGISAFIVELAVPFFAMLAVWRLAEIGRAFRDAFVRKGESATAARSLRIWEFTEKVCYAAGVIGLILGIVLSLTRVSGSVADLGHALGASLMSPLYGVLLALVCRILGARVRGEAPANIRA